MTSPSRRRFASVVRAEQVDLALACLLLATEAEPALDIDAALAELDRLAGSVDADLPPVDALRRALAGFTGDAHDYTDLRSSLLHEVLQRRAGLPILLSVVWLEVARRRGFEAFGIGLPGHFVVRVGDVHVDPFSGGTELDVGDVPAQLLRPWAEPEILLRILANIRAWASRSPTRSGVARWAVELSLLLPHHPLELRREYGHLLVSGGDFLGGAGELEVYADAVEAAAPDVAESARRNARAARARLN